MHVLMDIYVCVDMDVCEHAYFAMYVFYLPIFIYVHKHSCKLIKYLSSCLHVYYACEYIQTTYTSLRNW